MILTGKFLLISYSTYLKYEINEVAFRENRRLSERSTNSL